VFLISLRIHWQQFLSLKKKYYFQPRKSLLINPSTILLCKRDSYSYDYSSIYLIWGIVCFIEACTFGASSALILFFKVINFYVRASVKLFFLKSSLKVSDEKIIVYFVLTISSQLVKTEILYSIHITRWKKYFC